MTNVSNTWLRHGGSLLAYLEALFLPRPVFVAVATRNATECQGPNIIREFGKNFQVWKLFFFGKVDIHRAGDRNGFSITFQTTLRAKQKQGLVYTMPLTYYQQLMITSTTSGFCEVSR